MVDYFSRYPEVYKFNSTNHSQLSQETLKSSQFGIPEIVFSDNGPQVTSDQFAEAGPRMAAQESMQNEGAVESAGAPTGQ